MLGNCANGTIYQDADPIIIKTHMLHFSQNMTLGGSLHGRQTRNLYGNYYVCYCIYDADIKYH